MQPAVLFVDDEKGICSAFKRTFKHSPYKIYEANSGEQALSLLEQNNVDVIISDNRMPGMDGTQLLSIVKDKYPTIERVMLSGYHDFEALTEAINQANIFRFLSKPWSDEALLKSVDDAMEHIHSLHSNTNIPTPTHTLPKYQPLRHIPEYVRFTNDTRQTFFDKQIELEKDINSNALQLIESTIIDVGDSADTLHYFLLNWPRFNSFSHDNIIDMAQQIGFLNQLYTWYLLKSIDTCNTKILKGEKVVIDLFCEEMITNKSLRAMLSSMMQHQCHLVFRVPFASLAKPHLHRLFMETYTPNASIMLNIDKRIIDIDEYINTPIKYLEMDAKYNTIRNPSITEKRIQMLSDAQRLSIKTVLTEVKDLEQLSYAKKMNVDFFSNKLQGASKN